MRVVQYWEIRVVMKDREAIDGFTDTEPNIADGFIRMTFELHSETVHMINTDCIATISYVPVLSE